MNTHTVFMCNRLAAREAVEHGHDHRLAAREARLLGNPRRADQARAAEPARRAVEHALDERARAGERVGDGGGAALRLRLREVTIGVHGKENGREWAILTDRRTIRARAMAASESITVECPKCGDHFQDWFRPCANLEVDPELADPGYLDCAATATCPHCGKTIRLGVLTADGDVWRRR
jgi:hypothetical protein